MSEALAEDGSYNAVGFTYGSDYYDPSEPTEEEEPSKQRGERRGLARWHAGGGAWPAERSRPGSWAIAVTPSTVGLRLRVKPSEELDTECPGRWKARPDLSALDLVAFLLTSL